MKTAEEIKKEITETNARIAEREQKNDKRAAKLVTAWAREGNKFKKHEITPAEQENNERLERAMTNAEQENKRDRIRRAILKENLKAATFEAIKPTLWAILEKYDGKPYGEKTRAKIDEETRAACGSWFAFGERYGSAEIKTYKPGFGKDEDITIYAQNIPLFGGELKNRLRKPTEEEKAAFKIAYERARYTEPAEIDARIDEIIAAHKAAEEAQKAYNDAAAVYNAIAPDGFANAETIYNKVKSI